MKRVRKPEKKRPLGRLRRTWDYIEMNLKVIRREFVGCRRIETNDGLFCI